MLSNIMWAMVLIAILSFGYAISVITLYKVGKLKQSHR
ncbi:Hypothetical protein I595_1277 [Croceitalea dokdonensis DOKDO 023]|uniref:Uncharacterized protein n=1 Tax=Croceitalea dokdonensis DOKDO 023 TaxID=1300341 RepID=A0A0P7A7Q7_9FLAO|nr:Hypothetical protein I595_1277 [Croceitalea dokdonensis DOKDO 023]